MTLDALDIKGSSRRSVLRLAEVIQHRRPSIVHARNWNTWCDSVLACRLAGGVMPVLGFHGLETDGGFSARQKRYARWLSFRSRHFTVVSHAGEEQLTRELGIPGDRICVLTNGVDVSRFTPADDEQFSQHRARARWQADAGGPQAGACGSKNDARRALGLDARAFVLVMVASLVPVKNHALALDAIERFGAQLAPCHLLIVGDGPVRDELEQRARHLPDGTSVTFLGQRNDVIPPLQAADLFLLASRYEQMSNALLEAMGCGLPIVATDVGDTARVVQHERCGLIVEPGNADALGRAILRLRRDEGLRRRLGDAGCQRVRQRFCIVTTAGRYVRYYESLLERD